MEQWLVSLLKRMKCNSGVSKGKYCVKFTDPRICEESGEEEPSLNFISHIMMMTVKSVKLCRLRWAGHVMPMSENDPAEKVPMLEPGDRRPRGRQKLRWEEQIEEETAKVGCKGWKVIAARRDELKILLKKAKAHLGL
jgi:hypothetical protein